MPDIAGLKKIRVAIGIVTYGGQILISQRKSNDSFGGYWEFPGGKCEAGETPEQCVRRELLEELDIQVTPVTALARIEHQYPQSIVTLYPFVCHLESGEPKALCAAEFRWVAPSSLADFRFPAANTGLLKTLAAARFGEGAIDLPAADA